MKEVYTSAGKRRQNLYVQCDNGQRTTVHTLAQAREFARLVEAKTFTTYKWRKGKGFTDHKTYKTEE